MGQNRSTNSFSSGQRRSSNKTTLTRLGLVLIYLNLSIQTSNASHEHSYGGGGYFPAYGGQGHAPAYGGQGHAPSYGGQGHITSYGGELAIPPEMWPEVLTRLAIGGFGGFGNQGGMAGFYDQGANNGFNNNGGFYDDLFAQRNAYDVGKGFGNGYDFGKGSVVGGGYRGLSGKNKGHAASGFSNSYRKDESGDRSSYYDDGLGHNGAITYGANDNRFRDQGGSLGKGGFHNSNLNRYGTGGRGRYGDSLMYSRGGDQGGHFAGDAYGFRGGRSMSPPPPPPRPHPMGKKTGLYVIPMPPTVFFDQPAVPL